jgi:hypothetical protein
MDLTDAQLAQQWQRYAQKLEEDKKALIANVRWLMNVTHEVYHTQSHYDAGTLAQSALDAGVRPTPARATTAECEHASCGHSRRVLAAVAAPPQT